MLMRALSYVRRGLRDVETNWQLFIILISPSSSIPRAGVTKKYRNHRHTAAKSGRILGKLLVMAEYVNTVAMRWHAA